MLYMYMFFRVYPPDHGSGTLNSPEHSSVTEPSMDEPSISYQIPTFKNMVST